MLRFENSKIHGTNVPDNTDLNDVTTAGTYLMSGNYTYTNSPSAYGILEVLQPYLSYTGNLAQRITTLDSVYFRYKDTSGWKAWVKEPTRAEVDALKVKVNLAANSSATVNISNSARIVAYSISNNANSQGAFCISTTSTGSVVCTKIGGGEMITAASNASGKLTFTSTAPSGGGILVFMCFTGTVSEAA